MPRGRPKGALGVVKYTNGRKNAITAHQPGKKIGLGYVLVYFPNHPYANSAGYIQEHRLVAEQYYGGPIPKSLDVHHKNGLKSDNRLSNLEILDVKSHRRADFGWELRGGQWFKKCRSCGNEFAESHFKTWFNKRFQQQRVTSKCRSCTANYMHAYGPSYYQRNKEKIREQRRQRTQKANV